MQTRKRGKYLARFFVLTLAALFVASTAFGAELLRIQPMKYDCGVVNEGDPAIMQASVENISNQEVSIGNIKAN